MCETFYGLVLDARSKPIISMLENIRPYVMTMIAVKKDYMWKWRCVCGPNIIVKIKKKKEKKC